MHIRIKPGSTPVDSEITRTLTTLSTTEDPAEYSKHLTILERLYKLKAEDRPKRASRDTMIQSATSFGMAALVIVWESRNVWTSKIPLNFPGRSKT